MTDCWLQRRLAQAEIACRVMDLCKFKEVDHAEHAEVKTDRMELREPVAVRFRHGCVVIGGHVRLCVCQVFRRRMHADRIVSLPG